MDSNYDMRVTVPVLWDKKTIKIVNNESLDIMIMLNDEFFDFDSSDIDLYPINFRNEIDEVNKYIYKNINNGVYKCGFAIKQEIYDYDVNNLFIAKPMSGVWATPFTAADLSLPNELELTYSNNSGKDVFILSGS